MILRGDSLHDEAGAIGVPRASVASVTTNQDDRQRSECLGASKGPVPLGDHHVRVEAGPRPRVALLASEQNGSTLEPPWVHVLLGQDLRHDVVASERTDAKRADVELGRGRRQDA
jgi:hypothetical protein